MTSSSSTSPASDEPVWGSGIVPRNHAESHGLDRIVISNIGCSATMSFAQSSLRKIQWCVMLPSLSFALTAIPLSTKYLIRPGSPNQQRDEKKFDSVSCQGRNSDMFSVHYCTVWRILDRRAYKVDSVEFCHTAQSFTCLGVYIIETILRTRTW